MSSLTRQQLEQWLKTIEVNCDNCLDIGGSQNVIKGRTKSWEVKEYKILDLEEPHECKQKPNIICDLNKKIIFNDIKNSFYNEYEKYDIAFCMEVSEYWYDPIQALFNINKFLKINGKLCISFHFIYPQHNPIEEDCLRYTPVGIKKLLEETGFKIEEMKMRTMSDEGNAHFYQFISEERMRPGNTADHDIIGGLVKAKKI